jgi:hypothetical protein
MGKILVTDFIGKMNEGFLLVSELENLSRYLFELGGSRGNLQEDFSKLCKWVEAFGGKRGTVEWQKTGYAQKCWHGVFLRDVRFEDKNIYQHLGRGCYKRLHKGGEYLGWEE